MASDPCAHFAGGCENQEGKMETVEEEEEEEDSEEESSPGCTLFIKNLNFATTEETLREASCSPLWCTWLFFPSSLLP